MQPRPVFLCALVLLAAQTAYAVDCVRVCQGTDPLMHEAKNDSWPWTHPLNARSGYRAAIGDCLCECEAGYRSNILNFPCGMPVYLDPGEKPPESALPCRFGCAKVKCPPNAENIRDAASCKEGKRLGRDCCCSGEYFSYMTVEPQNFLCRKEKEPPAFQTYAPGGPDPDSCASFGVQIDSYDLAYDQKMLEEEFLDFLSSYAKDRRLLSGSGSFRGTIFETDANLFLHLGYTDDAAFLTGKESALAEAVNLRAARTGRTLNPSEVLEESLALNENYVFDALLTCHNFLRTEGGKRRDEIKYTAQLALAQEVLKNATTAAQKKQAEENLKKTQDNLRKSSNAYRSLRNLRASDNVGAWYHLFGTLTAGYSYPIIGRGALFFEHRIYKSNLDRLEYCWDVWGQNLGAKIAELDAIVPYAGNVDAMRNSFQNARITAIRDGFAGRTLYE